MVEQIQDKEKYGNDQIASFSIIRHHQHRIVFTIPEISKQTGMEAKQSERDEKSKQFRISQFLFQFHTQIIP